jgi:NADPH:quinone reductase-like Zn-dependent oxidoreductase
VKAIVQDRFGPPDVLRLADTGLPEAGPDDVLVRVHAAALNPADWHILRGDPLVARLMGMGLTRPKARVAGIDAAGVVEAAGANVRGLANGDDVLGFFRGAFAQYACAAADLVVPKPTGLTFEQTAAVPIAATTALRGIRDVGQLPPNRCQPLPASAGQADGLIRLSGRIPAGRGHPINHHVAGAAPKPRGPR